MEYIKNKKILYRSEKESFLLFLPQKRKYVILSKELFKFWDNIETIKSYQKKKNLSDITYNFILKKFKNDELIWEKKND